MEEYNFRDFFARGRYELRDERNISARELSLRLGQSVGYINHIEIGTSNPSIEMLFYICDESENRKVD